MGRRAGGRLRGRRRRVLTRNDREVAATYPELRGLSDALAGRPVVLDGEIVALDKAGRPSFGELQAGCTCSILGQAARPGAGQPARVRRAPRGRRVTDLTDVRPEAQLLEDLGLDGPHWATPPAFEGDGAAAMAASRAQGLEGVIAKGGGCRRTCRGDDRGTGSGEARPDAGGRGRRLVIRGAGGPAGWGRCCWGCRTTQAAGLRRARRHRLQRPSARRPDGAADPAGAADAAVRRRGATGARQGPGLGVADAGR